MNKYYPLIARAVERLDRNADETRRAVYERARKAVAQLRSNQPALLDADIINERLALEEAIRKVEAEAARNSPRETCAERRSAAPSEGKTDGDKIKSDDHGKPASPDRDDRPQAFLSRRVPIFLASASDDRDNADVQAVAIGRAYGADHYYDDVPVSRWPSLFLVMTAVLALAVLAGTFAYRGMFGGYVFPALPPILKAGAVPNNIVQNNSDKTSVTSASSSEKLQPIDIREPSPKTVPRVIATFSISSKPSAGDVVPAPTASTPDLVSAVAQILIRKLQHLSRRRRLQCQYKLHRSGRRPERSQRQRASKFRQCPVLPRGLRQNLSRRLSRLRCQYRLPRSRPRLR